MFWLVEVLERLAAFNPLLCIGLTEVDCAAVLQIENVISGIRDSNLKLMLAFGIGIHHAGLVERDRKSVEELFVNQRIQVYIYIYIYIY